MFYIKTVKKSSRALSTTWPYGRRKDFENGLRVAAANWFKEKGYETHKKMDYCLSNWNKWTQNIICQDVAEDIEKTRNAKLGEKPFPLHKYLHHGLSSQALAFNLLGPLKVRNLFEPIKLVLEEQKIPWPTGKMRAEFEFEDRTIFNEDSGQPTSIDFALISSEGENSIFIEVKLSEREFGGCSVFANGDCDGGNPYHFERKSCYLQHIGRKYWDKMKAYGFNQVEFNKGPICPFTCYYQFYRGVLFALAQRGSYVLLHDDRNPSFYQNLGGDEEIGLYPLLINALPEDKRERVGRITVQQLVEKIKVLEMGNDWIDEFEKKYGLV